MTDADDLPEADRLPGCPHPRQTERLFGQATAEAEFLDAVRSGQLHHGWLVTGPQGVGKATFAWQMARRLLVDGLASSDALPGPDHPVSRHMLALSEPRLALLRRPVDPQKKTLSKTIPVDTVRGLGRFFGLSAPDGGWRVVIVDSIDDMQAAGANALLKLLEEPPPRSVMFLISHQPARLLPTIRSRCRHLRCAPLGPDDLARALQATGMDISASDALSVLAAGSVGEAARLSTLGGLALYADIISLLSTLPRIDRKALSALADKAVGRDAEDTYALLRRLVPLCLSHMARHAIVETTANGHPPEASALFRRLCPTTSTASLWAEAAARVHERATRASAVNLDPWQVMFDMFLDIEKTAGRATVPA